MVSFDSATSFLEAQGFEVKDKSSVIEEASSCYNKKVFQPTFKASIIDYLEEEHYKDELEAILLNVLSKEELQFFLEKMKEENKMVLKKVFV